MGQLRAAIRSGAGGLLFGGVLYLAGDTTSDLVVYSNLHRQAMQLVQQDEEVAATIGQPFRSGAWYNATLAFSHRDKVAHCTFQLQGSRRVTDIAVKAGRKPGYQSNILYNILGPGTWELLSCQAMMPGEGGLVQARSLLPEHQQQQQQPSTGSSSSSSSEACAAQPAKQQQGQQGGRSRWGWSSWWRRRGDPHSQQAAAAHEPQGRST